MVDSKETIESESSLSFSTDEICRGGDADRCLSDDLDAIEANITALQNGKSDISHTHTDYLTEEDAVENFALINHTHSEYLSANHTHSDLENLIEALDNEKAEANHTHAQSVHCRVATPILEFSPC